MAAVNGVQFTSNFAAGMTVIFSQGDYSANVVLSDANLHADTGGLCWFNINI